MVPGADLGPVRHARATERVGADVQAGLPDRVDVDDAGQVRDVRVEEVVAGGGVRRAGPRGGHPPDPLEPCGQQIVGAVLDGLGDLRPGRTAIGRVVLESPVGGRVVGRGDHHAVREIGRAATIVAQDRVRQRRRRRVPVAAVQQHPYAVRGEDLQGGDHRRLGQRVRVPGQEQRAGDALVRAVFADGLADRRDVVVVERVAQAGAAVPGRAEGDPLLVHPGIGVFGVVGGDQVRDVHKVRDVGRLAAARVGPGGFCHR